MQNVLTLIITAIIVSLDSFVAGFSISLNKRQNITLPAIVALVTFAMCLITTFIGYLLKGVLDTYVNIFSAVILVTLAIMNLIKKDEESAISMQEPSITECIVMGIAVGMDACIANLSLAVMGYGIIAPVVFAVMHYFTVFFGQRLAGKITLKHTNVFSAIILFALAVMKFV
ncbi:MAG: manganese efflux pump [Clostridia bacterium]|nr:manganese efflux pump [Clostridia bacterium]